MKVKIVNNSNNQSPDYATEKSAGMDLRADLERPITLKPGERVIVPTGISIQLPTGYEAQIRPRSGLAIKNGITVCNAPGTVDSDFRGVIGVILINLSSEDFVINSGDRIAQMVIAKYKQIEWEHVPELDATVRGAGGFGHTGKK